MKKTILIVEDDKDMRSVYEDILSGTYNLIIVGNTRSALPKLKTEKIDLMILDIILPTETGDSFLARIKQEARFRDLNVLCITVLGDVTRQLQAIDPNVICIAKPFVPDELLKAVKSKMK